MNNYQDYLKMPLALTFEEMAQIHGQMLEELGDDEIALELYEDLLEQSRKYHDYRSNWVVWSREEKMDKDPGRSICHDTLLIKFNVLARYLRQNGKPAYGGIPWEMKKPTVMSENALGILPAT